MHTVQFSAILPRLLYMVHMWLDCNAFLSVCVFGTKGWSFMAIRSMLYHQVSVVCRTDEDDFLLLASDGLWDVMSNQVSLVLRRGVQACPCARKLALLKLRFVLVSSLILLFLTLGCCLNERHRVISGSFNHGFTGSCLALSSLSRRPPTCASAASSAPARRAPRATPRCASPRPC